eukprot:SAG31_NODE_13549_length_862_cov_1.019659_2_plen_148_part_00
MQEQAERERFHVNGAYMVYQYNNAPPVILAIQDSDIVLIDIIYPHYPDRIELQKARQHAEQHAACARRMVAEAQEREHAALQDAACREAMLLEVAQEREELLLQQVATAKAEASRRNFVDRDMHGNRVNSSSSSIPEIFCDPITRGA